MWIGREEKLCQFTFIQSWKIKAKKIKMFKDGEMKMKRQKRIICLCLILAMVITILPSEVKAQGKKTWGEAYEEVLKQYSSDLKAKLIYLDNDNIPEVYVDLNNGKVVLLSYDLRVKRYSSKDTL